jgi:N-ethylmaleimide reductase
MLRLGRLVLTPEEGGVTGRWQLLVTSPALFAPLTLRGLTLPNRLVVAPMCQYSVTDGFVGDYHLAHLGRFALGGFGLVVVEATGVTPEGRISHGDVGLWSDEHVPGLARVVDFLHAHGSAAGIQLAHAGAKASSLRPWDGGGAVTPENARPGEEPWPTVSASAVPAGPGWPTPHALTVDELAEVREAFVAATLRSLTAGFDVVEIHAAHGYLLHQFLAADSNLREDSYGGSLENRARLMLEVTDAVVGAWSADRVGVRISPIGSFNGTEDPAGPVAGLYVAGELSKRNLAFLHLSEPDWAGGPELSDDYRRDLKAAHPGIIVGAGNYDATKAERLLSAGLIDAAAFGRSFIANPDLPRRLAEGLPLNAIVPDTFYGGAEVGYTDYPVHA